MNCDKALRLIELRSDGEATKAELDTLASHLTGCGACREHEAFLRAVEQAAAEGPADPPEVYWQHFPSKVMARLDDESAPARPAPSWLDRWFSPPLLRFASGAAVVTIMISLGVLIVRDADESEDAQSLGLPVSSPSSPSPPAGTTAEGRPAEAPPAESAIVPPRTARDEALVSRLAEAEPAAPPTEAGRRSADSEPAPSEPVSPELEAPSLERAVVREATPRPEPLAERQSVGAERSRRAPRAAPVVTPVETMDAQELTASETDPRETLDCDGAREALAEGLSGEPLRRARYVAARCSIEAHLDRPEEAARARAVDDADAFLALESDSERAREIRELAAPLRR